MKKFLIILLVMLLALYPVVELTRVIIMHHFVQQIPCEYSDSIFIFEMCAMYLCIIPVLYWRLK